MGGWELWSLRRFCRGFSFWFLFEGWDGVVDYYVYICEGFMRWKDSMAFYSSVRGRSTGSTCRQSGRFRAILSSLVGYGIGNLRPAALDILPALGSVRQHFRR